MSVEKSTKKARGTAACENTNIELLKANDYVADIIRKHMTTSNTLLNKKTYDNIQYLADKYDIFCR
jgi:hypothetical protein